MRTARKIVAVALLAAVVLVSGFATYLVLRPSGPCLTLGGTSILKNRVNNSQFTALTEYHLPSPIRWANAIAVAPDDSVWFGEQSVPGVGHLFANGTLVEYPWPSASHPTSKTCDFETSIWGIAIWNGMVWGTDGEGNAVVGINPQTGAARVINVTGSLGFPYTLSVGSDGALWFTSLTNSASLGRVAQNFTVAALHVNNIGKDYPAQLDFVNASYAYMVVLNNVNNTGRLFSFNPSGVSNSVDPQRVGSGFRLLAADSVTSGGGRVWVAQHGPSSLAAFDTAPGSWTLFPTTHRNDNITTLPYFVAYGSDRLWFNEHYGNRIGFIEPGSWTMTEYSESNPPASNESVIGNDLTIATTTGGLWFTSTTGNYIGFANASYAPSFSIRATGETSVVAHAGGQFGLIFTVAGSWDSALSVVVSDTETYTAVPASLSITPSARTVPAGSGPVQLRIDVGVGGALPPGNYTLAVTVSNGLVQRAAFVFLTVN